MWTFFYGWRRKAGCVVLTLALVTTAQWVESFTVEKSWAVVVGGRLHGYLSKAGTIFWLDWSDEKLPKTLEWQSDSYWPAKMATHVSRSFDMETAEQRGPIRIIDFRSANSAPVMLLAIPYWSIVLMLTFLSAYLILWKPQKRVVKIEN